MSSLVAGEDASVGEMMAAAGEIGAFTVDAGDLVAREEVRALIEGGEKWLGVERRRRWFLERGLSDLERKTEEVTSKLEIVAESIAKILSEYVKNQTHSAKLQKLHSVALEGEVILYKLSEDAALSLHITGSDRKFCIHFPRFTSVTLPSGCILATVGKQFEEFGNSELKGFDGEIFLEPSAGSFLS